MNITSLLALLQAAAAVLTFAQSHAPSAAFAEQAVNFGSNAVQLVTQAAAPINFSVPANDSIWPNIKDLLGAPYIDGAGHWTRLGSTVQLIQEDTSFGDINHDGMDDAAVIVNRPSADGAPNYYLAAMLNQGGIMFNVADFPLGASMNIASHTVANGIISLDGAHYGLLGNTIQKN